VSQTTCKNKQQRSSPNPVLAAKKIKFFLGHDCTPPLFIFDMFSTPPFRGLIKAVNQNEKLLNTQHTSFCPALHLD
jgi:hypothetical protein